MKLRPYQQAAHDAVWNHIRTSVDPCLVEAATGAGKSHLIAALARTIHDATGKRVLCLAPSAELVTQNRGKYLAAGFKASMFSASAGAKELRHNVVFGSPLTIKNRISRFQQGYAAVIIDEAHGLTPTLKAIIDAMRGGNPNLRVIGTTATPYRLGDGYIFRVWPDGKANDDHNARDPYFPVLVDRITAPTLIEAGFLTPPSIGNPGAEGYDTAGMQTNSRGQFDKADVDRAYHGHGRKTAGIVADVIQQARNRAGVMFFAATVQHAQEIMASLPPELSALVTGDTKKGERDSILRRFKARQIKYLVNVSVLTTGFDAPHVDCIAILRKTESVGLLQQIVGRGLRLDDGKKDCLVLDYTTNIQDHCPDGDLFTPVIEAKRKTKDGEPITATCPDCGYENEFKANPDYIEYKLDDAGYCLDLEGNQIETDHGPLPGHYGRRCFGVHKTGPRGEYERCGYRWTSKECPECAEPNDIAARYCCKCRAEIVDPNERLREEFQRFKKTPTQPQTDEVTSLVVREGVSSKGNRTMRADFVTPWRSFSIWFLPEGNWRQIEEWERFNAVYEAGAVRTVTYRKDAASGFYRLLGLNKPQDEDPSEKDAA